MLWSGVEWKVFKIVCANDGMWWDSDVYVDGKSAAGMEQPRSGRDRVCACDCDCVCCCGWLQLWLLLWLWLRLRLWLRRT